MVKESSSESRGIFTCLFILLQSGRVPWSFIDFHDLTILKIQALNLGFWCLLVIIFRYAFFEGTSQSDVFFPYIPLGGTYFQFMPLPSNVTLTSWLRWWCQTLLLNYSSHVCRDPVLHQTFHLIISLWTHSWLFQSMGYTPLLFYSFPFKKLLSDA